MLQSTLRTSMPSSLLGCRLVDRPCGPLSVVDRRSAGVQCCSFFPVPPSVKGQLGDTYAVVEIGGGQQIVEEGRNYTCHRLNVPVGSTVKLPRVLIAKHEGEYSMGDPYVNDVTVEAEILEDYRAAKILVFKYRPKKHYKKIRGHRQCMTRFRVTKISKE